MPPLLILGFLHSTHDLHQLKKRSPSSGVLRQYISIIVPLVDGGLKGKVKVVQGLLYGEARHLYLLFVGAFAFRFGLFGKDMIKNLHNVELSVFFILRLSRFSRSLSIVNSLIQNLVIPAQISGFQREVNDVVLFQKRVFHVHGLLEGEPAVMLGIDDLVGTNFTPLAMTVGHGSYRCVVPPLPKRPTAWEPCIFLI